MIEYIKNIDQNLFLFLNSFNNDIVDSIMLFVTHKYSWIPLYVFFLYLLIKHKGKNFWIYLIIIAICITLSDQISTYIKHLICRYRPCHNLDISNIIHIAGNCGGKYGFVSSHATNSFSLATILFFILKNYYKSSKLAFLLFFWATLVSYSRIYVGVHYPLDIICGAILGMLISIIVFKITTLYQVR